MGIVSQDSVEEPGERDLTGPRSLTRLLALFEVLSSQSNGLSLTELSNELGSPKSSLLNLVRPLVAESFLIHTSGTYRLGPSIFRLASGVLNAWYVPRAVHPVMERLAKETGETVLLAVMDPDRSVLSYVDIVHSPHPVRYQIAIGTTRPLYANASGRVFLAFADKGWRQSYLADLDMADGTAGALTKPLLKREIDQVASQGWAVSIDSYMAGMSSVAAPLLDAKNHCMAVLCIAGPTDRFVPLLDSMRAALRTAAGLAAKAVVEAARQVP